MNHDAVRNDGGARNGMMSIMRSHALARILLLAVVVAVFSHLSAWMVVANGVAELERRIPIIVEDALRGDPDLLRNAVASMQAEQARREEASRRAAVADAFREIVANPGNPVRGNPAGDVMIVEFFDVRCPFCRRLHGELEEVLRQDGMVGIVMRDMPILGPQSLLAAQALVAAREQGGYGRLYHRLMSMQGDITEESLRSMVEGLGLDWSRLRAAMEGAEVRSWIEGNLAIARRLSVSGTPALIIGDELVVGAVDREALRRLIDAARRRR